MFPASYFAKTYFPGVYWPPTGIVEILKTAARFIFQRRHTRVVFFKIEKR